MNDPLDREIARLSGALRRHSAVIGTGWGLAAALVAGLVMAVVARITPWLYRTELLLVLVWLLGAGTLAGALLGYSWPRPLPQRLHLFDHRLHLANRLTTAWELAQGRIEASSTLARLQYEETLAAIRDVEPRRAFPAQLSRRAVILATIAILGLLPALLIANPQEAALDRHAMQQQATEAAIDRLEAAQAALAENPALSEAEREAALRTLEEALAVLQNRHSTPDERQTALATAEHQLEELRSADAEAQVQRLSEAAPHATEAVVQPLTEALQRGDTEAVAAYLRDLLDPTTGEPLTPEQMLALADTFEQLAGALQETDAELAKQFREIAQETYSGDIAGAQQAIAEAAGTLSETAQAKASAETLEAAQAALQQAQESLSAPQRQTMTQASEATTMPSGEAGTQQGQGAAPSQAAGETAGSGTGGTTHSEDTGSSAPYGNEDAPRITGAGGEITVQREMVTGAPHITDGIPGAARVPYQDVYATYAATAEADLSRNVYPPALRSYVREYFSSLDR